MKETPILFTGPMVRAILAGKKTQTRRLMKPQPEGVAGKVWPAEDRWAWPSNLARSMVDMDMARSLSPYGTRGDRLWVKETWAVKKLDPLVYLEGPLKKLGLRSYGGGPPTRDRLRVDTTDAMIEYAAHPTSYEELQRSPGFDTYRSDSPRVWRPSIFMPRWASRITLEVASVRVERVQGISEADAWAEGIDEADGMVDDAAICKAAKEAGCSFEDAKATYGALWDEINGARKVRVYNGQLGTPRYGKMVTEIDTSASWAANPWVWVVEFRRAG